MTAASDTYKSSSDRAKPPQVKTLHEFETEFENNHPLFSHTLTQKYSLTPTELHICQMIRSGMKSKEIADMLFIEVGTVGVHRTNIRKKMGLKGKPPLGAFLLSNY